MPSLLIIIPLWLTAIAGCVGTVYLLDIESIAGAVLVGIAWGIICMVTAIWIGEKR
jgi:hypothetical protein